MRLIRLVPFALVFGLVPACGGSDTGGEFNSDGGVPLEELPAKYAAAACSAFSNCYGDVFALLLPGEDCNKTFTIRVDEELAPLQDAVDAGRVKYHGDKVQACIDELSASDCAALSNRAPESCEEAVEGTIEMGGDCTLDEECLGQAYCKIGAECPGTCTVLEVAGGPCSDNSECKSGLKCGDAGLCVKPSEAGEACEGGEPKCIDGYFCLGADNDNNVPGECVPFDQAFSGKAGDPCGLDSNLCVIGLACEITSIMPVSGDCVDKVGSGDACHVAFPDECPDDEYCLLGGNPLNPLEGTCTSKPEATEPCGKGLGPTASICAPGTRCDDGVCRDLAHLGENCSVDSTCYSEHCVGGGCVASNSCPRN